eukprot:15476301-Alexandrium_andersonii.AAC.1
MGGVRRPRRLRNLPLRFALAALRRSGWQLRNPSQLTDTTAHHSEVAFKSEQLGGAGAQRGTEQSCHGQAPRAIPVLKELQHFARALAKRSSQVGISLLSILRPRLRPLWQLLRLWEGTPDALKHVSQVIVHKLPTESEATRWVEMFPPIQ